MGAYRITVIGTGPHHNREGDAYDAEKLASRLVRSLEANGHVVVAATFEGLGQVESVAHSVPVGAEAVRQES